ncbi:MAG: hypothetical protein CMK09_00860 [Ponticaulis sp.]|nr:hypothetical protein [Ponticaulis sp.]
METTLPIRKGNQTFDGMKEACERLGIARTTMLRYLDSGFFSEPDRVRVGRNQNYRIFTAEWYAINEPRLVPEADD